MHTAPDTSFAPRSASIGNVWAFAPAWTLSTSFSASERAPTSFELYANGVHAATGAFERGDPTLAVERGHNVDAALEWKTGTDRLRVGAYSARFSRFIALEATGSDLTEVGEDGEIDSLPVYAFRAFRAVRAKLHGIEIDGQHRLLAGPWTARVEYTRAASQDRVPATDTRTAGHQLVNLALTREFNWGARRAFGFVRLDNATDALAYSASTIETIRSLAPLAGRSVKAGLRVVF